VADFVEDDGDESPPHPNRSHVAIVDVEVAAELLDDADNTEDGHELDSFRVISLLILQVVD